MAATELQQYVTAAPELREMMWKEYTETPRTITVEIRRIPRLDNSTLIPKVVYDYVCTSSNDRSAMYTVSKESNLYAKNFYAIGQQTSVGRRRLERLTMNRFQVSPGLFFDAGADIIILDLMSLYVLSEASTFPPVSTILVNNATRINTLAGFQEIRRLETPPVNTGNAWIVTMKRNANQLYTPGPLKSCTIHNIIANPPSQTSINILEAAIARARSDILALFTDPVTGRANTSLRTQDTLAIMRELDEVEQDIPNRLL